MTCTEAGALLSDLLDGELAEDARGAVEAHLAGCGGCTRAYRALRRTVRFVRANASTPLVPGTPGGIYSEFTRAIVDDTYGQTPVEVMLRGLAAPPPERGES